MCTCTCVGSSLCLTDGHGAHTAILPRQMRSALRGCAAPQPLYRSELTFDIGNPISSHAKQNLNWHRFCICTEEMTRYFVQSSCIKPPRLVLTCRRSSRVRPSLPHPSWEVHITAATSIARSVQVRDPAAVVSVRGTC